MKARQEINVRWMKLINRLILSCPENKRRNESDIRTSLVSHYATSRFHIVLRVSRGSSVPQGRLLHSVVPTLILRSIENKPNLKFLHAKRPGYSCSMSQRRFVFHHLYSENLMLLHLNLYFNKCSSILSFQLLPSAMETFGESQTWKTHEHGKHRTLFHCSTQVR